MAHNIKPFSIKDNRHVVFLNETCCVLYVEDNYVVGGYFTGHGKRSTQTINPNKHVRLWAAAKEYEKTLK